MARNLPQWRAYKEVAVLVRSLERAKETDVVTKICRWVGWRALGSAALAVVAAGSALAQDAGRSSVKKIDHAVEFYISNDALEAQYVRNLDLGELGPTEMRAGFLYNEDGDLVAIGDLLADVGDEIDARSLELRVGTRVYGAFLAPEDQDVFSVGLGGEAQYFLGSARNASVTLGLFYGPDIATFGTADHTMDISLRLMTRMRNGTDVFVGYRSLEFGVDPSRDVDDNLHLGFRRSF